MCATRHIASFGHRFFRAQGKRHENAHFFGRRPNSYQLTDKLFKFLRTGHTYVCAPRAKQVDSVEVTRANVQQEFTRGGGPSSGDPLYKYQVDRLRRQMSAQLASEFLEVMIQHALRNRQNLDYVRGPSHKYPLNGLKVEFCYPKTSCMKWTTFILSFSMPEILS